MPPVPPKLSATPPPLPVSPLRYPAPPPPLTRRIGSVPPKQELEPLDIATLSALQTLPLRAHWLVEAAGMGYHRSPRRGSDIEFADYRAYQPGDDLRRIDWRLYARTDRLHVRRSHTDTPLRLVLLLDTSASMAYCGGKKRFGKIDHARALLGALALIGRQQRDPCGVGLLDATLAHWLPPGSSTAKAEAIWQMLDKPPFGGGTDLPAALEQTLAVAPRRCLFVLASDFYVDPALLAPTLRHLRADGHELIALRVLDPVELDFPFTAASGFVDLENGERLAIDPAVVAPDYRAAFARHATELEETVLANGGDWLSLRTDVLPLDALRAYLGKRHHCR